MQEPEGLATAVAEPTLVLEGGVVTWANPAAARLVGVETAEALVGRRSSELLAGGDAERLELIEAQRQEGWPIPGTCRVRFVRADGSEVPADVRCAALERAGAPARVISARDVRELRRAETLLASLTRLTVRDDAIADPDALLDVSEPVFRELGWTVAFSEIVGDGSVTRRIISAADDPVGDYGRSLVGRFMPFPSTPVLAEAVRDRKPLFLDNVPGFLTGPVSRAEALSAAMTSARVTRSAWCPVFSGERVTHLLAVTGHDLTEHDFIALQTFSVELSAVMRSAELRGELIHRERLAAIGEMAAVLAHEVRNPLSVIFNALSCIRRALPDAEDVVVSSVSAAQEEAERLRRLVTEILDFARPPVAEPQSLPLGRELGEAADAARQDPSLGPVVAELRRDLPADLPMVHADAALLRRALVNVLLNAFQQARPGSPVRVAARVERGGLALRLDVDNDCDPVPSEVLARVFEPFFTTRPSGTGLGLAVVRQSLLSMGGSAELRPTPTGVRVSLVLPAASG